MHPTGFANGLTFDKEGRLLVCGWSSRNVWRMEKDGSITHNLRTAVIAPDGRVTAMLDNNAWTAEELARALRDAVH